MIYGTDSRGKALFHELLQLSVRVDGFCARKNQNAVGLERVFGKKVFSFSELEQSYEEFYVIVSGFTAHNDVKDLRSAGVKHIVVENITANRGVLLESDVQK